MVSLALGERGCVCAAPDPDHEAETAGAPRGNTGSRILEQHRLCRRNAQALGGF